MPAGFRKLTPVNGFDKTNSDNARQNNYAWCIEEMGDYLYVGTGRNFVYGAMATGQIAGLNPPPEVTPTTVDMKAEIWRIKKDGKSEWEIVYKAPYPNIIGFRFMIRYTTPSGETALYAGAFNTGPGIYITKSTTGESGSWEMLNAGIPTGASTRSMIILKNKLYMAVLPPIGAGTTAIYSSDDPKNNGWTLVTEPGQPGKNPRGELTAMTVFNGHLYVGAAKPGGFEVWRTKGELPEVDKWQLVVDKGAGDALNEIPLTLGVFKNYLYVGTAIRFAVLSLDPQRRFLPPKGFDLIRIDKNDKWELIIGGDPAEPTQPTVGQRNKALSMLPSGCGFISNAYCWQLREYNGEFYMGTWDWTDLALPIYRQVVKDGKLDVITDLLNNELLTFILNSPELIEIIGRTLEWSYGFDLYKSPDGIHWTPVSLDGLGNHENYGLRNLFPSLDGRLYAGTANPFKGCEIWYRDKSWGIPGLDLNPLENLLELFNNYINKSSRREN